MQKVGSNGVGCVSASVGNAKIECHVSQLFLSVQTRFPLRSSLGLSRRFSAEASLTFSIVIFYLKFLNDFLLRIPPENIEFLARKCLMKSLL